jgi:hypothetical protein
MTSARVTAEARGATRERLEICLDEAGEEDPRAWFADIQAIVECDAPYLTRLAVLQRWRAVAVREGDDDEKKLADDAILALEQGAALGEDAPEEAPPAWGYGVQRES